MDNSIPLISIREIQGTGLNSPYAGQQVRTEGLVTGVLRRGFYLQTPFRQWDGRGSNAVFVYSQDWMPELGYFLEVSGEVVDYQKHDNAKPVTQIHLDQVRRRDLELREESGEVVEVVRFDSHFLPQDNDRLAAKLNSLEGMLVEFPAGMTFIAPSNPFGDYVLAFDGEDSSAIRTPSGGVLAGEVNPDRWYPGFRVYNYRHAQQLNVGAKLLSDVKGPLHYRVDSWQMAVNFPFKMENNVIQPSTSTLKTRADCITIMTLNCFNLDPHVESKDKVLNPSQDVDDDWGEGRFHSLARAVVEQAHCPDVVALQEIQDNDGAEQSDVNAADQTYELLIKAIKGSGGIDYHWVDISPVLGADGGQPGGNIRNGFLYNPQKLELVPDSVMVIGRESDAFIDSRKPLVAAFRDLSSGEELVCVNVHLASKRHQNSIFAPDEPGVDAKLSVRLEQATEVANFCQTLLSQNREFYITGDFNDTEHSATLKALCGDFAENLVLLLPNHERFDYNHRGKLQVLMHGVVPRAMAAERAEYEIIHGNELLGVEPGVESDKPSDHAYVIARLKLLANK